MNKHTEAEVTWRFYADQDDRWKWQRLSETGKVMEQSSLGYDTYEECVADAQTKGYVFQLPVPGTRHGRTSGRLGRTV